MQIVLYPGALIPDLKNLRILALVPKTAGLIKGNNTKAVSTAPTGSTTLGSKDQNHLRYFF